MTMQPQIELDVNNPWQMAEYFGRWLLAADPKKFAESIKRLQDHAAMWAKEGVEKGMLMHGFKRGNRQERYEAYVRKYNWPLGHPIIALEPVIDPLTGQDTGQVQEVPTGRNEDLWDEQLQQFPRQFVIDARDADEMGAPLPEWVRREVGLLREIEATPEGKRALKNVVETKDYAKKALRAA